METSPERGISGDGDRWARIGMRADTGTGPACIDAVTGMMG